MDCVDNGLTCCSWDEQLGSQHHCGSWWTKGSTFVNGCHDMTNGSWASDDNAAHKRIVEGSGKYLYICCSPHRDRAARGLLASLST